VLVILGLASCASVLALGFSGDAMVSGDIALIRIEGVISGTSGSYGGGTTPEYVLDQISDAVDDDAVKAIVLRIDSPGGTVAASQEITLAVRRAAEVKPVVASIGDIGASGAYMVASQCTEIVASPGSSVGSIGVIMEVLNLEGLLEKLGVEFTVLTKGEFKDVGSSYREMTDDEKAMLEGTMTRAYDQFIADVALGRGMSEAEVRELATGWVWLGEEALELGLVDRLGNYDDAIDAAAELGGIEGEPQVVTYEEVYTFDRLLFDLIGFRSSAGIDADALGRIGLPR
jgi:protease-4